MLCVQEHRFATLRAVVLLRITPGNCKKFNVYLPTSLFISLFLQRHLHFPLPDLFQGRISSQLLDEEPLIWLN